MHAQTHMHTHTHRCKHTHTLHAVKQEFFILQLLQFLVSLMNSHTRGMAGLQRKRPLMINNTPQLPDAPGISPAKIPNLHLDDTGDHAYTVQSVSLGSHAKGDHKQRGIMGSINRNSINRRFTPQHSFNVRLTAFFPLLVGTVGKVQRFIPCLCFLFFFSFFFEVEISSHTPVPLFRPESVHSDSAS